LNTFGYVGGNPVRFTDSSGLFLDTGTSTVVTVTTITTAVVTAPVIASQFGLGIILMAIPSDIGDSTQTAPLAENGTTDWDEIQKQQDHANYHRTCDRQPPPGLDPCEEAKWQYRQALSCQSKRKKWEDRWGTASSQGPHDRALGNVKQRLNNVAENIKRYCPQTQCDIP